MSDRFAGVSRLAFSVSGHAFIRNVSMLTGSAVVAQGIAALSLPILTRLYTPESFSILAVYSSVVALGTVISCLRFNIAIPLARDERSAADLLALAALGGIVCAGFIGVVTAFAPDSMVQLLRQPSIRPYLWMFPIGILFASLYDALQYWASRKRRFALVSRTRVTRATAGSATQLAVGATAPGPLGLVLGHMVFCGMGVAGLLSSALRSDRESLRPLSWHGLRATAQTFRQFPLFSVPEALANTAGSEVSMLIIAAMGARSEAGFLMLAMRVMGLPMALLGTSIGQVYLSEAQDALADGRLRQLTMRIMRNLFLWGGPPLLLIGAASPFLFPVIFGTRWARAGVIVAWLTPMFVLQLVASPVSTTPHVLGRIHWAMILQIFGGIFRIGMLILAVHSWPSMLTPVFALSGIFFYMTSILLTIVVLRLDVTT